MSNARLTSGGQVGDRDQVAQDIPDRDRLDAVGTQRGVTMTGSRSVR